ncbi:MAG: hypothetical protein NVSMB9_15020 [Isosphaeraceae bacterium]
MLFEEIRYRQPVALRRPDRDRQWACLAHEVPTPDDLPIFLHHATADAIERHALRDTLVELGGILLGKECLDDQTGEPFVFITRSIEAKHYANTQASFTYTHDSWEEISRDRDRLHPDLDIVGWYHTHPDFGVFLSGHDLFIQRHFFAQPLQVAYVVDPVRQTRGFFRWRDGQMAQVGGFFLSAERSERLALARLANDLENVPNAAGSGGGLSPRLEAELIAMLTRPANASHALSADRTLSALMFGMLGTMLGVVAMAALFWLNTIHGNLQEQAKVLEDLRKTTAESADRQRVALDALEGAGGTASERFLERYSQATRERDDARRQLANQRSINDLLAARSRQLAEDLAGLTERYDKTKTYEKDARELPLLRTRFAELKARSERQDQKLAEQDELLDTPSGQQAMALDRKYQRTWYAAVAGWGLSLLLGLSLIASHALRLPQDDPSPPGPEQTPPHRIV